MNNLVFINSNNLNDEPFTTSKVIAEYGGQEHRAVRQLIETYTDNLKQMGRVTFQMTPLETNGGIQNIKIYKLNEQQATFLITLMKNTKKVVGFKLDLVKQFYLMRNELNKRIINREKAKEKRNALTEALGRLPPSPHKAMKYKHYTDLVYKIVFDKNTKQLRQQYGISDKETPRDYLSVEDISKVEKVENEIAVLIDFGNQYSNIKTMMLGKYQRN